MESLEAPQKQVSEEAQLLKEGRQLAKRALHLSTQTHKIKVWVPILCSMILTGYYLYGLHKKQQANTMDLGQPVASAPADNSQQKTDAPVGEPQSSGGAATSATPDAAVPDSAAPDTNASEGDLRKQAEQAHAAQQFGDEAKLWQQFMARSTAPQAACPAIGVAFERAGDIDSSIQAFEKCVALEPKNADTAVAFAHALATKGDFERAAMLYRQILANDPKNLDAQTGIALLDLRQNHLREAETAAMNVLQRAPNQTDALLVAGLVAWRESRLADAEKIFLRGAALDDQRADFHAFLGRIAEAERRPQQALMQYDKALSLDPNDVDIAARRDRLQQVH